MLCVQTLSNIEICQHLFFEIPYHCESHFIKLCGSTRITFVWSKPTEANPSASCAYKEFIRPGLS